MNKNKAKGTAAETAFVRFMTEAGYPCERRALQGKSDRGDVSGLPFTIEIKSGSRLAIPAWLEELAREQINDKSERGFLIIKPKGKGKVKDWWVLQTVGNWISGTDLLPAVTDVVCGCGKVRTAENV